MTTPSLAGSRVLVTGASSGIGAAIARDLVSRGAAVVMHCHRHVAEADALAQSLEGGSVHVRQADLRDAGAWGPLVDEAAKALGGLDGLVNNAGTPAHTALEALTPEAWHDAFALHVHAPFFLAQHAFRHMTASGGGRIVNVSSIGVRYGGSPTTVAYSAAKAALENVTLSLAKAGAPLNILVNAVRPGVIDTPAWSDVPAAELAERIARIPLRRAGTPAEVAALVRFLLSADASYITGQIIGVAGGD